MGILLSSNLFVAFFENDEEVAYLVEDICFLRCRKMMEDMEKLTEKSKKEKDEMEEKIAKMEKTSTCK